MGGARRGGGARWDWKTEGRGLRRLRLEGTALWTPGRSVPLLRRQRRAKGWSVYNPGREVGEPLTLSRDPGCARGQQALQGATLDSRQPAIHPSACLSPHSVLSRPLPPPTIPRSRGEGHGDFLPTSTTYQKTDHLCRAPCFTCLFAVCKPRTWFVTTQLLPTVKAQPLP